MEDIPSFCRSGKMHDSERLHSLILFTMSSVCEDTRPASSRRLAIQLSLLAIQIQALRKTRVKSVSGDGREACECHLNKQSAREAFASMDCDTRHDSRVSHFFPACPVHALPHSQSSLAPFPPKLFRTFTSSGDYLIFMTGTTNAGSACPKKGRRFQGSLAFQPVRQSGSNAGSLFIVFQSPLLVLVMREDRVPTVSLTLHRVNAQRDIDLRTQNLTEDSA